VKKPLLSLLIISFAIIFFLGVYVGLYKIFPYEVLDSSKDILFEQKTIENNKFVNQANVYSLIKIDSKLDIDQKRDFLIEYF
jgi:hypothetical protein